MIAGCLFQLHTVNLNAPMKVNFLVARTMIVLPQRNGRIFQEMIGKIMIMIYFMQLTLSRRCRNSLMAAI